LTDKPFVLLFFEEVKKSHRWASIYFSYDVNFPRSMRFLLLVSVLICTLFFSAVLYNISDPDDSSCDDYKSEGMCLRESSQFSSQDTKCYWRGEGGGSEEGRCQFKEPNNSALTVVYVATMSALLSVPFLIIFEYVIINVLCRPTAVAKTSTQPSTQSCTARESEERVGEENRNNAMKSSNELTNMVVGLLNHFKSLSAQDRNELEEAWGLTSSQLETYLATHQIDMAMRTDCQTPTQHGKNTIRPSTTTSPNIDMENHEVVASSMRSRPSMLRRTLNMIRGGDQQSVFDDVLGEIVTTRGMAEKETLVMASLSPKQQGRRLLVLFQKDLLANVSGEINEKKSMQGKMVNMQPLAKWKKVLGYIFIASLDLGLLFYILLFAMNQDKSRQMAWIFSYAVWLILEVVVVSSMVLLMSHFAVPSMMLSEIKATKAKMIDTIQEYQFKLQGHTFGEAGVTEFNAAPYLFVASRLAVKFPESIESEIIRDFSTSLPKRTFQPIKMTAMDIYRMRLRLTAVTLTLLSLERCFYDLVCWACIGFVIIWHIIFFKEYALLAGVMLCTLTVGVGVLYYTHHITNGTKRNSDTGVITIHKKADGESTRDRDSQRSDRIMHDVVSSFRNYKARRKYNPRFARAMALLRKSPSYRQGTVENESALISFKRSSLSLNCDDINNDRDVGQPLIYDSSSTDSAGGGDELHEGLDSVLQRRQRTREMRKVDSLDEGPAAKDSFNKCIEGEDKSLGISESWHDSSSNDSSKSYSSDSGSINSNNSFSDSDIVGDYDSESDIEGVIFDSDRIPHCSSKVESSLTAPPKRESLAVRIRRNREAIHKLGLKKQAKEIEDTYVLNFERRRSSIMAHQARADAMLQKRIAEKNASKVLINVDDGGSGAKMVPIRRLRSRGAGVQSSHRGGDTMNSGDGGGPRPINKLSSFEVFTEKKAMVSKYNAHQALRKHSLETQRRDSKALLERKLNAKGEKKMSS
jgi:hypothetical protein